MGQPLISIILPCYNVEQFVGRCLDSLLSQTYPNIEVIAVNDGSTDGTTDILRKYARQDKRIRLIEQPNKGLSGARNKALQEATGTYIMYVDSDDWIEETTCVEIVDIVNRKDYDVVFWGYTREFANKSLPRAIYPADTEFHPKDIDRLHKRFFGLTGKELSDPSQGNSIVTVWGKLYKAAILKDNRIQFIDTKTIGTGEDILFNIQVFTHVRSAYYLNKYFYHYRKTNTQALTITYKRDLYDKWNRLHDLIGENIPDDGEGKSDDTFSAALQNRICLSTIDLGLNELYSGKSTREQRQFLYGILSSPRYRNAFDELDFSYFPVHWKLFFHAAKNRKATLLYLMLLAIKKLK